MMGDWRRRPRDQDAEFRRVAERRARPTCDLQAPVDHQKGRVAREISPAERESIMSLEEAITECVHDMLLEAKRKGVLGDTTMRQVKDHMKEEMGEVRRRQPHSCPALF
jgi:hypothetical protein